MTEAEYKSEFEHTKDTPQFALTHWGRVTHICVGKLSLIGSDNGLSPGRRQAIIRTNAGILLIGPLGTNFSEIWTGIQTFSLKKIHTKMSSGKCRPFFLGLNVLMGEFRVRILKKIDRVVKALHYCAKTPGVRVTEPIFSIPLCSPFPSLSKQSLAIEYHIWLLSCRDTCQIWMWFKETGTFARSKISPMEKLTNGTLVTPTPEYDQLCHPQP